MNHDTILAVLPSSKDDAKSLKEIAIEMGLDITTYVNWIRAERRLSSSLRALARWGWVDLESRKRTCYPKEWRSSARPANGPNSIKPVWVIFQEIIRLAMSECERYDIYPTNPQIDPNCTTRIL
jgi:hypothetical protein